LLPLVASFYSSCIIRSKQLTRISLASCEASAGAAAHRRLLQPDRTCQPGHYEKFASARWAI